ncbi:MAG: nucleotidyltransferase domain-containing protein [bacterium]
MTTSIFNLYRSKLREKLLAYFFSNPGASHHLREIASLIGADPGNLSKELKRLCAEGVFQSETRGRQKYFSINTMSPIYPEIKSLVAKTIGVETRLRQLVSKDKSALAAFIYGSLPAGGLNAGSDIDLMVVSKDKGFNDTSYLREFATLRKSTGREIDFTHFTVSEWTERYKKNDSFIKGVMKLPRIILKGDEKELRRLG